MSCDEMSISISARADKLIPFAVKNSARYSNLHHHMDFKSKIKLFPLWFFSFFATVFLCLSHKSNLFSQEVFI